MPVAGNRQPYGLLHGGASAVLAETLGSVLAALNVLPERPPVGLELSCTHHRAAVEGWVTGTARPVHVGRSTSTSEIVLVDDQRPPDLHGPVDLPAPRHPGRAPGVIAVPAAQRDTDVGSRRTRITRRREDAPSGPARQRGRPARNTASGRAPPPPPRRPAAGGGRGGRAVDELAERVHGEAVPGQRQPRAQQPPPGAHPVLPRRRRVSTSTLPSPRSSRLPAAASSAGRPDRRVTGTARSAAEAAAPRPGTARARGRSARRACTGGGAGRSRSQSRSSRATTGVANSHRSATARSAASSMRGQVHHPRFQARQYRRGHRTGRERPRATCRACRSAPVNGVGTPLRRPEPRGRPAGRVTASTASPASAATIRQLSTSAPTPRSRSRPVGSEPGSDRAGSAPMRTSPRPSPAPYDDQPGLGVVRAGRPPRERPPAPAAPPPTSCGTLVERVAVQRPPARPPVLRGRGGVARAPRTCCAGSGSHPRAGRGAAPGRAASGSPCPARPAPCP